MIKWHFNGEEYTNFWALKQATPNFAFTPDTPDELLKELGITREEVADPEPVVDPVAEAKQTRAQAVHALQVTVDGMTFDGDEWSQIRISKALAGWGESETIQWVLSDNTVANVTKDQLHRALQAMMVEMDSLWVAPYKLSAE